MLRASLVLVACLAASTVSADEIMPLSEVKAGMLGVGRTVFKGTEIEEFKVEILGVLHNTGPRQNMILARLAGGPLEKTGVIMGMSGSPVYVGKRVIGAVSAGFPFAEEAIAGITPIEEMIAATSQVSTRPQGSSAAAASRVPFKKLLTVEELSAPLRAVVPAATAAFTPLNLPVSAAGFSRAALDAFTGVFGKWNLVTVVGGAQGEGTFAKALDQSLQPLQPGSALSVQLVRGDLDLSAVGTVTYADRDRIYAFGHPFINMGSTQFPMARAEVITLLPNLYSSFKIASTTEVVGTVDQDRSTAIAGRMGPKPRMIPINVELETSMHSKEKYRFEIVPDKFLAPILTYVTVLSTITSREREYGESSLRLNATINLESGSPVVLTDVFSGEGTAGSSALLLATPIYYLLNNPYRDVSVSSIDIGIQSEEVQKEARLERVEFNSIDSRPGKPVKLRVHLEGRHEESVVEEASFEMPRSARPGDYILYVGDGNTLDAIDVADFQGAGGNYPPSYSLLVRALNNIRKNNRIYFRLMERRPGIAMRGEDLSDMPGSAAAIVASRYNTQETRRVYLSPVFDAELPTRYAVAGYRLLQLKVRD